METSCICGDGKSGIDSIFWIYRVWILSLHVASKRPWYYIDTPSDSSNSVYTWV